MATVARRHEFCEAYATRHPAIGEVDQRGRWPDIWFGLIFLRENAPPAGPVTKPSFPVTKLSYDAIVVDIYQQEQGKMEIVTSQDQGATAHVVLKGRLDIVGAEVIALPLATLAGSKQGLILDMSGVSFVASIGLRHLVQTAKALSRRGGRLVLLNPSEMVAEVLTTSGLTDLLPIVRSDAEAAAALASLQRG
jgi:anti-anti-sigma factor